ncbi:type IV pilus inner membrane component PilO [Oceanimonas smirnovii]|uniref:type 4a pilus biogenesis protein PilO n=1 Tax=Oceanimonas smirnovii TaxID=264574 RepID=UPI00376FEE24
MNLEELNELELEHIGQWPRPLRVGVIAAVCLLLCGLMWQFLLSDNRAELARMTEREASLKNTFEAKAAQAVALPAYEKQLKTLKARLDTELQKLPSRLEVAGLLDGISFIATDNGLQIERINWEAEQPGKFSIELPMRIIVSGSYHQLGHFVADIAALPRIVILDSFTLSHTGNEQLNMSMQAKTYQYNPQEMP